MSAGEGLNVQTPRRQASHRAGMAAAAHMPASCGWLTPVLEMANLAAGNTPLPPCPAPARRDRLPLLATRVPAAGTESVPAAREFTVATLQKWGVTERTQDVATVMCELLTNALQHALPESRRPLPPSPIRLGLLQPGACVLCAVADPSGLAPVPKTPEGLAETGRGLHIVCALSDNWGFTTPSEEGKVVWAVFFARPVPPPRSAIRAA